MRQVSIMYCLQRLTLHQSNEQVVAFAEDSLVAGLTATMTGASMMVAFATTVVVFAADIVPLVAFMAAARFKVSIGMHWL